MATKTEIVRFRLTVDERKRLDRIAKRFKMGKSKTLRTLIDLYVAGFMGGK